MAVGLPASHHQPLSPEAQLLLICARPRLSDEWRAVLRALVERPLDWDAALQAAQRNFVSVLLRKHLLESVADLLPAAVVDALNRLRKLSTLRALEVVRIQRMLASDILAKVPHVFIKGATLAQRYFGDPFLRQYRDIDVLLDDAGLLAVGAALIGRGYVISNPDWGKFKDANLAAFCRYTCVLELRSPTGVSVELHRTLDNTGCVFSSKHYLATAITGTLDRDPISVLPSAELFVYLCFHHSRHQWSSLHWCADLHAFWQHPEHDPAAVKQLARRLGMQATVAECGQLRRDLDALAQHGALPDSQGNSRLLADCLAALHASITPPLAATQPALPEALAEPDFRYPWQKTLRYRWRFQWARLKPTANDYNALPLPLHWHWLYYLLKPIRVLHTHWARVPAAQP